MFGSSFLCHNPLLPTFKKKTKTKSPQGLHEGTGRTITLITLTGGQNAAQAQSLWSVKETDFGLSGLATGTASCPDRSQGAWRNRDI